MRQGSEVENELRSAEAERETDGERKDFGVGPLFSSPAVLSTDPTTKDIEAAAVCTTHAGREGVGWLLEDTEPTT